MANPYSTFGAFVPPQEPAPEDPLRPLGLDELLQAVMRRGREVFDADESPDMLPPFGENNPNRAVPVDMASMVPPMGDPVNAERPAPLPTENLQAQPAAGVPYAPPGAPMPLAPPNQGASPAPARRAPIVGEPGAAPQAGVMDQLTTFLAGMGRGGGAVLPALGEGARAVRGENSTARALAAQGVNPEMIQAALSNPAIMQQVVAQVFKPQHITVAPDASVITPGGREIYSNRNRFMPNTEHGVINPHTGQTIGGGPRRLSDSQLDKLREEGAAFTTVARLGSSFRPEFALPGTVVGGSARNWVGRNLPSNVTAQVAQDASRWWQDYERNSQLFERHALFGAALTPTEQAAWYSADINPNMNPEAIRTALATRQRILESGLRKHANTLIANGNDPAPIAAAFGISLQDLGVSATGRGDPGAPERPAGAGRRRTFNPQTGQIE